MKRAVLIFTFIVVLFISSISYAADLREWNYLGEYTVTTYCPGECCNGEWVGYPAKNGSPLTVGRTVAVDPEVIPLDSTIMLKIDGELLERVAEDTGSAVKGNKIDLLIEDCSGNITYDNVEVWIATYGADREYPAGTGEQGGNSTQPFSLF